MTMKQFREATEHVPDDSLVIIDYGDGQQVGEHALYIVAVKTVADLPDDSVHVEVILT